MTLSLLNYKQQAITKAYSNTLNSNFRIRLVSATVESVTTMTTKTNGAAFAH